LVAKVLEWDQPGKFSQACRNYLPGAPGFSSVPLAPQSKCPTLCLVPVHFQHGGISKAYSFYFFAGSFLILEYNENHLSGQANGQGFDWQTVILGRLPWLHFVPGGMSKI
jgi:hypothetical protein